MFSKTFDKITGRGNTPCKVPSIGEAIKKKQLRYHGEMNRIGETSLGEGQYVLHLYVHSSMEPLIEDLVTWMKKQRKIKVESTEVQAMPLNNTPATRLQLRYLVTDEAQ